MSETDLLRVVKESDREVQLITDPEKIGYLLDEYIGKRDLFVKNSRPPAQATIAERQGVNECTMQFPLKFAIPGSLSLYCNYNKQMELECTTAGDGDTTAKVTINAIRIALQTRSEQRYQVEEDTVMADSFLISKNQVDLSPLSYAVSNKVIFHEYEKQLGMQFPNLQIIDMDPTNRSLETMLVKKEKLGALIADVNEADEYGPKHEGLANLQEVWKNDINAQITRYKNEGIRSLLIHPISYENLKGEVFPLAYFMLKSSDKAFTMEDYNALDDAKESIIDRIKDANTLQLNVKQEVMNLGLGGCLLRVSDRDFKEFVIKRQDMTFDVVFKLQAPLRFYGLIRHIHEAGNRDLLVGIQFEGIVRSAAAGSGEGSRKRLEDNIGHQMGAGGLVLMN